MNCRYADERIRKLEAAGKLTRCSRFVKWAPVTMSEMQGFFAVVLIMGILHLLELEDYWKTSWVCKVPFFHHVLPRDRFELIFWMLHVSHTEPGQPIKKLDKVRRV